MIQQLEAFNYEERLSHLNKMPENSIYIVPDIKSKLQFQNHLLKQQKLIPSLQVERASDFYSLLFFTVFPDYTMISSAHTELLFQTWISRENYPSSIQSLSIVPYLQSFLPMLTHPDEDQLFKQLIQESSYFQKYKQGYEWTKKFWNKLKNMKMMEKTCCKYALFSHELNPLWNFSLIVDLGFSLDYTELEIYLNLSRRREITVLSPPPLNSPIFTQSHIIYSILKEKIQQKKNSPAYKPKASPSSKQVHSFPSLTEEVQFAAAQLRQGLDQGLLPSQTAILAPNIEVYWPCLKSYLKKEGIPFHKNTSTSYLSFPQIQQWLSSIRLSLGFVSFENVEDAYSHTVYTPFDTDHIRHQYYYCSRPEDIQKLPLKQTAKPSLSLNEFLELILKLWNPIIKKHPNPELDSDLNNILSDLARPLYQLKSFQTAAINWMELLENILLQKDKIISHHDSAGVHCVSLNAIYSIHAKQVHILGLDHDSCQKQRNSVFHEKDAQKIFNDLGFYCTHLDPSQNEYELTHFINFFQGSMTLSWSRTLLNHQTARPSRVWHLENKKTPKKPKTNLQTVWGSIKQLNSLDDILQHTFSPHSKKDIQQALNKPHDITAPPVSLSPTNIQKYIQCPFIFLSEDIFHLTQRPPKDTDLNPMDKGKIIHKFFENIIKKNIQKSQEIQEQIQSMKADFDIMDEDIFKFYSEEFFNQARLFLQHEQSKNKTLPEVKTIGTEVYFKGFWNFKKKQLDAHGDTAVSGKIDRIDLYKNQIMIIDYKSNLKNMKTASYWNKSKIEVQMPLYMQALEKNLLHWPGGRPKELHLAGALYLSYKNFEYKGLVLDHSEWRQILSKKASSITSEKKESILSQVNQILHDYMQEIQKGVFFPDPFNKSECEKCLWSQICRAPHLH